MLNKQKKNTPTDEQNLVNKIVAEKLVNDFTQNIDPNNTELSATANTINLLITNIENDDPNLAAELYRLFIEKLPKINAKYPFHRVMQTA